MIEQITVFLENSEGRLAALCRTMADAEMNMHPLVIADTADYGLVRIICDDPARALEVLNAEGYRAISTKVAAPSGYISSTEGWNTREAPCASSRAQSRSKSRG